MNSFSDFLIQREKSGMNTYGDPYVGFAKDAWNAALAAAEKAISGGMPEHQIYEFESKIHTIIHRLKK